MQKDLKTASDTTPPPNGTAFAEKASIFSHDYLKCNLFVVGLENPERHLTQKFYSTLASASTLLEDFLDYHGAKNNKNCYGNGKGIK